MPRFAHKAAKNCTVVLKKLHHYSSTPSLITTCLHFTAQLFLNERTHAQNSRCTQEGTLNSESTKKTLNKERQRGLGRAYSQVTAAARDINKTCVKR